MNARISPLDIFNPVRAKSLKRILPNELASEGLSKMSARLRLLFFPLIAPHCSHFGRTPSHLRWALLPLSIPQITAPEIELGPSGETPLGDRLSNKRHQVLSRVRRQWEGFGKAPPESSKKKLHRAVETLQSKLDPDEIVLSQISDHLKQLPVDILYPSQSCPNALQEDLRRMLHIHTRRNTWLLSAYSSLLPLPFSLSVVPGPNIFLLGNAIRIASLWKARQASLAFEQLLSTGSVTFISCQLPLPLPLPTPSPLPLFTPQDVRTQIQTDLCGSEHHPLFSQLLQGYYNRLAKKLRL